MNSNMVKREKFDHLHLVYHFTVPLMNYCSDRNVFVLELYLSRFIADPKWQIKFN